MRGARVLLVEEGLSATLRLARALDDAGADVTVLTADGSTATCRRGAMRWCSGPPVAHADFVPHVDALVTATGFDRVLLLTEPVMQRVWDADVAWRSAIFPRAAAWQRRLVLDKHALVEHMAAHGIAVPRHHRVDAAFDARRAIRELGLPLVVKGATGGGGSRVRIVDTAAELAATLARARQIADDWIVQEHVASPTYLFGGLFRDGAPLRMFAGEKLAQHPPRTGGAIRLRSTNDAALVAAGTRVVAQLQWTGFASLDFVRRGDGAHLLLEVNPRLWGSHAAAAEAGVDLFAPFVQLLAGDEPRAELAFATNIETWIFPRYLQSPVHRGVRGVARALRDLVGDQGRDWRDPRFVLHALRGYNRMRSLIARL